MPPIAADKMTEAQKKAVADYKALRGVDMTGPPWTVLLRVPDARGAGAADPAALSQQQRAAVRASPSSPS